jgi:tetratricopeptide (TPR) repeat protein
MKQNYNNNYGEYYFNLGEKEFENKNYYAALEYYELAKPYPFEKVGKDFGKKIPKECWTKDHELLCKIFNKLSLTRIKIRKIFNEFTKKVINEKYAIFSNAYVLLMKEISKTNKNDNFNNSDQCLICYSSDDEILKFNCQNKFHHNYCVECFLEWFKNKLPICIICNSMLKINYF